MNIVTATFSAGCTQIDADRKLWQYDQGQVLQLVGLDLPDAYQVEFSNSRDKGSAKAQIGGPDGVLIPDEYLTTGKPVYAFLVGHTAEEDRETEKLVVIYVNARSQPTDEPITPEQQSIVDQLIAALTAGVAKAEDAAAQAEAAISYMPKIVDGTWWVYDAETETWADTGIQAEGQDGVGISDAVLNADYTLTLTFSDGTSYTTPPIRGPKGEDAPTDYILVQPTQPTSPTNRLWVDSDRGSTVQLPTMADHQALEEDVAANTQELANQKSAIEDLQDLVDRKAGMLVDTASGPVASFFPDATIPDLLGLDIAIEPVQDLHGYDNPWPAGGGANIFDAQAWAALGANRNFYTVASDETITVNSNDGSDIANRLFDVEPGATYAFLSTFSQACRIFSSDSETISQTASGTFTAPNDGKIAVKFYASSYPASGKFILVKGSTVPSAWSPYENRCPISGWDAVGIQRTGVNILDAEAIVESSSHPTTRIEDGYLKFYTGNSASVGIQWKDLKIPTPLTGFLTIKNFNTSGINNVRLLARFDDGTSAYFVNEALSTGEEKTVSVNVGGNKTIVSISSAWTESREAGIEIASSQLELGTTATAYRTYAGNRYTIALGQTVYGCRLVINEDGVTALVDRAAVDMGALNWAAYSAGVNTYRVQIPEKAFGDHNLICSAYKTAASAFANMTNGTIRGTTGNAYVYVRDNNYTDVTSFRSAVTGQTIVYELATPITIQLDPVTISTISGQTNNVWADAGDTTVEYAADIKAYIDRLNQSPEDDMIANTLIAANKYFTVNNRLFLSTASIAAGAQIIPGTNCTETSLVEALNALNA